jgi:hypothetical protein
MTVFPEQMLRWVRGEIADLEFERWVYANADLLESQLGPERAGELLELDYRPGDLARESARNRLRMSLVSQLSRACACPLMRDRQSLPLCVETRATPDSPFYARFTRMEGGPNGSELWQCKACGQEWLVILDWDADGWYLERLSSAQAGTVRKQGLWPGT